MMCFVQCITVAHKIYAHTHTHALTEENRDILERAGFYSKCGKEWLFPSIQDAVYHAKHDSRLVSPLC